MEDFDLAARLDESSACVHEHQFSKQTAEINPLCLLPRERISDEGQMYRLVRCLRHYRWRSRGALEAGQQQQELVVRQDSILIRWLCTYAVINRIPLGCCKLIVYLVNSILLESPPAFLNASLIRSLPVEFIPYLISHSPAFLNGCLELVPAIWEAGLHGWEVVSWVALKHPTPQLEAHLLPFITNLAFSPPNKLSQAMMMLKISVRFCLAFPRSLPRLMPVVEALRSHCESLARDPSEQDTLRSLISRLSKNVKYAS